MALAVLVVARLLSNEQDTRGANTFSKDCLSGVYVQIAALTLLNGFAEGREIPGVRNEMICAWIFFPSHTITTLSTSRL
jgi:hypothetical protein